MSEQPIEYLSSDDGAQQGEHADDLVLQPLWSPSDSPEPQLDDIGSALAAAGLIEPAKLDTARQLIANSPGKSQAAIYIELGVGETAVREILAKQFGVPFQRIGPDDTEAEKYIAKLGLDFCKEHGVLPIKRSNGRLWLGVTNPDNLLIIEEVRHRLGLPVKPVVVTSGDINLCIETKREETSHTVAVDEIIADVEESDVEVVETHEEDLDLEKIAGESPVIRYVNYLIFNAVKEGASDIHIEPQEKRLQIRYRIDGVMFETTAPPGHMHAAIISRLKIMANLDISERRLPQDGRIRAMVHGRKLDLRVSTLPTAQGEKAVLRILDTRSIQVDLDELGMDSDILLKWKRQIAQPHGILLVTGPTGSGKTTTLYASIGQMNRRQLNISTVEDPVEYHLNGINQTQTLEKIGMSFSAALRALLRQDPDVIMLGEIRDGETAKIAIQASLTGHLVLSTLHTNDAPSSMTRLINIGVEPYLIGSAVNACLAQRLVRRICDHCKKQITPDPQVAEHLATHHLKMDHLWEGQGCDKCRNTGYSGRLGLYELLILDDALRDHIAANPSVNEFRRTCIERGMVSLRDDGFKKVAAGQTTVEEVLRVTESAT